MKNKKIIVLFMNLILFQLCSYAQKLPNKQEASIWAPANIKIDGYANEWDNHYQAYNKTTETFYTIANDDSNLYLTIHATNTRIIEKIIEGGISFTVDKPDKNNESLVILFPLLSMNKARSILIVAGKKLSEDLNSPAMQHLQPELMEKQANSLAKANKQLVESLKEIKLNGINSIIDTIAGVTPKTRYYGDFPLHKHHFKIIGIDNQDGIKAMTQFEEDGSYTYELSIPIKYIGFSSDNVNKFKYNITINSRGEDERYNDIISYSPPPNQHMLDLDLETLTDFSGEYTLAKKP